MLQILINITLLECSNISYSYCCCNSGGVLKFKVRVDQNTPAGIITNIAEVDPDGPGTEGKTPSNPNDVTVLGVKKGTINDRTEMPLLMWMQQLQQIKITKL
jgi:hypothetical protein